MGVSTAPDKEDGGDRTYQILRKWKGATVAVSVPKGENANEL